MSRITDEFVRPLLHIGYHKTGTTWLQKCVFQNVEAGFSQIPGAQRLIAVNPFDFKPRRVIRKLEPRIREARAQNLMPVLSSERLSGDPYTGGYDSEIIAERLAAVFPNARVLLVIREQTSMFLSIYKEYIMRGGAASIRQYITPPGDGYWLPHFRFDFLEYHRLISRYQDRFGARNVLVLPYELLRPRPGDFFAKVSGFLGLAPAEPRNQPMNVSLSALSVALRRHANRYIVLDPVKPAPPFHSRGRMRSSRNRAVRWMPSSLRASWKGTNAAGVIRPRAGLALATHSNVRTAASTGLDLRTFGYDCE